MKARKATFAGSWYPDRPTACEREISAFLKAHDVSKLSERDPVGGIVPHAGWYFSGSIACNVIRCLGNQSAPDVIVVFGMHLSPRSPNYIMATGAWETPFGDIPIAEPVARELLKRFSFQEETVDDPNRDNTIELQLPFIKYFYPNVKIVPIGVPPRKESLDIGRAAVDIAAREGLHLKTIGSTDLTHYGFNYGFVPQGTGNRAVKWVRDENDRKIIAAMLALDAEKVVDEALANQNSCCAGAAATAIAAGKALGAETAELLAYASSYDKSPGDSFVGYAGIVF